MICTHTLSISFRTKTSHIALALPSVTNRKVACRFTTFQHLYHPNQAQRSRKNSLLLKSLKHNIFDILEADAPLTSTKSQTIKKYRALSKAKYRVENDVTLLEGHRLIIDTLTNPKVRELYQDVLVTREALQHHNLGHTLSDQLAELVANGTCRVRLANDAVVRAACDTVNPQGVVAILKTPKGHVPSTAPTKNKNPFYLLLDGVSDPGNVGTLLRSASAVGVEAVILLPNCCDVWSPKAVRSAMGATFHVPIAKVSNWEECLEFMERCNVSSKDIYAATMEGNDVSTAQQERLCSLAYHEVDWLSKGHGNALCIGKEGTGLSSDIRHDVAKGVIRSVHVPMDGGIESLNAAVCGSVILFEYHRQCHVALR